MQAGINTIYFCRPFVFFFIHLILKLFVIYLFVKDYITLTAIFSNTHAGGFHVYIEEIPELSTTACSFDTAIDFLKNKLKTSVRDTSRLKIDVHYKHVISKSTRVQ